MLALPLDMDHSITCEGGREGGREGGSEGGREGGRERGRERARRVFFQRSIVCCYVAAVFCSVCVTLQLYLMYKGGLLKFCSRSDLKMKCKTATDQCTTQTHLHTIHTHVHRPTPRVKTPRHFTQHKSSSTTYLALLYTYTLLRTHSPHSH